MIALRPLHDVLGYLLESVKKAAEVLGIIL
jgi:hypothetical protein